MSQSVDIQKPNSAEALYERMKHDTPEYQAIYDANCIVQCQSGSRLHGVVVDTQDDSDEMAIVIEPPEYVIRPPEHETGFKRFAQYEHRTAGRGKRSGPTDECLIAYSLRKWVGRAAHGDPTMLIPLLCPENQISRIAWPGHDLRKRREMFLSRQIGERYLGYLDTQLACLNGTHPTRTNRPELIAKHGFDTKYAFHALRLAYQGHELMREGALTFPIAEPTRTLLTKVRLGYSSLDAVLRHIDAMRSALIAAHAASKLPDQPNYTTIGQWMADTYRMWWDEHPLSSTHWGEPCI